MISTYDTRNLALYHLRCAQHFAFVSSADLISLLYLLHIPAGRLAHPRSVS